MIRLGIVGVGDMGSKYAEKIFTHDELGFKITACTRVKGKNLERIKQYMTDDIKIYDTDDSFFEGFDNKEFEINV